MDSAQASTVAPHSLPSSSALPPPGCPMHVGPSSPLSFPLPNSTSPPTGGSCPIKAPVESSAQSTTPSTFSKLNPLNYMPTNLSQNRSANQTIHLPVDREMSSIPRGDSDSNWEYPSPQQMYNAMLRKGYDDTPQDAVESMVAVHNFLNEGAWAEIVEWEETFAGGLIGGWAKRRTSELDAKGLRGAEAMEPELPPPKLLKFQGRPKDMTPKASILQLLGRIYPSNFGCEPPFDRHDWFVERQVAPGQWREVRYVIDYYSAPPEPTGEPVFYLDVRPAIDGPTAAAERLLMWSSSIRPKELWDKASGASVRGQKVNQ